MRENQASSPKAHFGEFQHLGACFKERVVEGTGIPDPTESKEQGAKAAAAAEAGRAARGRPGQAAGTARRVSAFQSENKHDRCSFGCSSTFHLDGDSSGLPTAA